MKYGQKSEGNSLFLLKLLIGNFISLGVKMRSGPSSLKHAGCEVWLRSAQGIIKSTAKVANVRESVTVLQLPVRSPLPH